MNYVQRLRELGFTHFYVLDGEACGIQEQTLLLALWAYDMEHTSASDEAWIHPYYRISHKAYMASRAFVEVCKAAGHKVDLRDDIRLKPIFSRLPGLSQGRNTLSYLADAGSRFYTKAFAINEALPHTHTLEEETHPLHCGSCTRCMDACPTHAIAADGFHMERCIRYWMMPGKPVPEDIRSHMGNRLIGCDECQRCCPHNPPSTGAMGETVSLLDLLEIPKIMVEQLKGEIGVNLTLPNRMLSQACMIAGCSQRSELLPVLTKLAGHPSQVVGEHAAWAAEQLKNLHNQEP